MIVHGHVVKTRRSSAPHHFNNTSGRTYGERRAKVLAQLAQVERMLANTTDVSARGTLNSTKNMLLGTLSYIDARIAQVG